MLIASVIILVGIFILNIVVGMYYKFGVKHYWFFEMEHFLGGFFVAMLLYNFTHVWWKILLGLAAISFVWELAEYLLVKIKPLSKLFRREFHSKPEYKLGDTILDIFLNFTGALVFMLAMG